MRKLLRRVRRLSWRERLGVIRLGVAAVLMEGAVRVIRLPKLARLLRVHLVRGPSSASPAPVHSERVVSAEQRAQLLDRFYRHWPIQGSCLRRSLLLGFRLRDLDPVLRIGVAREDGEVRAHAWVEVDGQAIGREDGDFAPLRSSENA